MKNHNLSKAGTFFCFLLLLLLTYFRENFLLEINASMALEEYNRSYSYWLSDFFENMTHELLIKWKWGLTMFFSVVMTFVTILSLYCWYKSIYLLKIVGLFYLVFLLIVCVLSLVGFVTNSFNDLYIVLRKILGLVQSPIPFFVFFVLFYWIEKKD